MAHRIYLVEDHPVMRKGYAAVMGQEMDLEICGVTGSVREARQHIPEVQPDLVIVDLALEDGNGLELIKDLHARLPDLPMLVVTMRDESVYAERVLQAGARGYLMKDEADARVVEAARKVLRGGLYLSPALSSQLLMQFAGNRPAGDPSPLAQLSDRELEVFEYLGQGLSTREIAEQLTLSPKTVDSYRTRAKEKLSIDSNAQLRRRATLWVEHEKADP
jgi:DNA-binding NarL/FixJ family response regulator